MCHHFARAGGSILVAFLSTSSGLTVTRRTSIVRGASRSAPSPLRMTSASATIDSHLHVWATADEAASTYPYAGPDQTPPTQLQNLASPSELLKKMSEAGVDGALIVQPINHKFDHSYVAEAMRAHPGKFKGMMLHDPSLSAEAAVARLEELVLGGFVGVRFNPYLWPEGGRMSESDGGSAVYRRCGELNVPVGVMCFKGLGGHIDDIEKLISQSPGTVLVLDHLGFCALNAEGDKAFDQLLSLAKNPNVMVKVSALFRNTGEEDSFPYDKVKCRRFDPLLEKFGHQRLMMGSDFPFVLETEGSYIGAVDTVRSWVVDAEVRDAIMGGTAERAFGPWGTSMAV